MTFLQLGELVAQVAKSERRKKKEDKKESDLFFYSQVGIEFSSCFKRQIYRDLVRIFRFNNFFL